MLTLQVTRPQGYTTGRTQSYRLILSVDGTLDYSPPDNGGQHRYVLDKHVFVVLRDGPAQVPHLDHVALPVEFSTISTTQGTPGSFYRASLVDLYLPNKALADQVVTAVVQDIQDLLTHKYGRRFTYKLDGGDQDTPIKVLA